MKRFITYLLPLVLLCGIHIISPIEKLEPLGASSDYVRVPEENEGRGPYKDGVYEGSAPAYKNELFMQVTVQNGWISGLSILKTDDDKEYLEKTEAPLLNGVLESQSTDLDAITGATFTSYGLLDSIDNALENAL